MERGGRVGWRGQGIFSYFEQFPDRFFTRIWRNPETNTEVNKIRTEKDG